jgi:hypothetical protein
VEDCHRAGHRLLIDDFVFLELTGWGSRAELGEKAWSAGSAGLLPLGLFYRSTKTQRDNTFEYFGLYTLITYNKHHQFIYVHFSEI